jgi:sugar phosphate isomerase/epimerase
MDGFGNYSRRGFIGAVAGVGLSALAGIPCRAGESKKSPYSLGIQSYSLRAYPVQDAISHARDIGFEHIEFYPEHLDYKAEPGTIESIKDKVNQSNMKMVGYGVPVFTADHDANRQIFEFAKLAGLWCIAADPDPESFDSLERLVKEFDIRIAIHNHGPSHRYNKALDVLSACEPYDRRIGACADLGHYIRSGEDATQVIRLLGDRLHGVHLKDFSEMKEDARGVILGRGQLDVDGVFDALVRVGFPSAGCLSLEYEENAEDPLDDIRECLAVARKSMARITG